MQVEHLVHTIMVNGCNYLRTQQLLLVQIQFYVEHALYSIGKMAQPHYFTENQGEFGNPHNNKIRNECSDYKSHVKGVLIWQKMTFKDIEM